MLITTVAHKGFKFRYSTIQNNPNQPTIVFIGGSFQSIESIRRFPQCWPSEFNDIVIELPGFGSSDLLPYQYGFDTYVECIEKVLLDNKAKSLIAYAYSYGCGPMFRVVSRNEHRFTGLILSGASAWFTTQMIAGMAELIRLAEAHSVDFPNRFLDVLHSKSESVSNGRHSRLLLMRLLRSLTEHQRTCFANNYKRLLAEHRAVDRVSVPTLCFTGEHDQFTSFARLHLFNEYCSSLHITAIPETDHFYHLQAPKETSDLVRSFCISIDNRSVRSLRG